MQCDLRGLLKSGTDTGWRVSIKEGGGERRFVYVEFERDILTGSSALALALTREFEELSLEWSLDACMSELDGNFLVPLRVMMTSESTQDSLFTYPPSAINGYDSGWPKMGWHPSTGCKRDEGIGAAVRADVE
jgi:hypothetical protein